MIDTRLVVTRPIWEDGAKEAQLIWSITVQGASSKIPEATPAALVIVDAQTGIILNVNPIVT